MARISNQQTMFAWLSHLTDNEWWLIKAVTVLVVALLISLLVSRLAKRLHDRFAEKDQSWETVCLHSVHKPLQLFIWVIALSSVGEVLRMASSQSMFETVLTPLRQVGTMVALTWFALRFIRFAELRLVAKPLKGMKSVDPTTASAVSKLLRLLILFMSALFILPSLGFTISGVLAFGSVGALSVSFAAKDLLANFFGSMMLYIDKPFKVGDWISSPDKQIEGTVEEINWRLTRIRTFDKRPLYVPNSMFLTISVLNPSRMLNRRIKTVFGVRYDDWRQVDAISQSVTKMLREHPDIDTKQTLFVNLVNFGHSSLDILVYSFTKTTNWLKFQAIQHDVFLKILEIVEQHGAECAFPTQTLHIPNGLDASAASSSAPSSS